MVDVYMAPWLQLRMELSKRAAEVSALEARVSLQSDYIQQLEACVGQVRHCHHDIMRVPTVDVRSGFARLHHCDGGSCQRFRSSRQRLHRRRLDARFVLSR